MLLKFEKKNNPPADFASLCNHYTKRFFLNHAYKKYNSKQLQNLDKLIKYKICKNFLSCGLQRPRDS